MTDKDRCDWPGCDRASVYTWVNIPEVRVSVSGEPRVGDTFSVCKVHLPKLRSQLRKAVDRAIAEAHARENLAPGEPEWERYFGHDDD